MDEYISREELRKHLKECYDNELFDADMRKATIGIDVYVENMPAADVQPVDRWISVEDKFPNDRERVIVYTVEERVLEMKFDKRHERWGRLDIDGMQLFGKSFVTHWMPLPEPPKDGDAE